MINIEIYTKEFCPFCQRAKDLLLSKGLLFKEIIINSDTIYNEMFSRCGRCTVPQIFFNNKHVGGWDDLYTLNMNNQLHDSFDKVE